VGQADEFDLPPFARAAHIVRVHSLAVRRLDADHFRRRSFADHGHALGEPAVGADDGLVALFERIHHRRFNSAGARGGDRVGHLILGQEDPAQQHLHITHHGREPRVHVADKRRGQSAVHARVHVGRARSHHQPGRGKEFTDWLIHGCLDCGEY
jgi:hypothetical protein